ncbi:conserved hypothetical protein [Trichinella spiralis]|uniref:hypothetical protein n=1 Tax=Trichinella spiralis TaxID=6334 RepID=UPI0001EFCEBB|nr:conserved hypothetical protein [Trichinella spiralis]
MTASFYFCFSVEQKNLLTCPYRCKQREQTEQTEEELWIFEQKIKLGSLPLLVSIQCIKNNDWAESSEKLWSGKLIDTVQNGVQAQRNRFKQAMYLPAYITDVSESFCFTNKIALIQESNHPGEQDFLKELIYHQRPGLFTVRYELITEKIKWPQYDKKR